MPKFAYTAFDNNGAEQYGILEAATEADAVNELGRRSLIPTEVRPANITDSWRIKRRDQINQHRERAAREEERVRKRHTRQRLVVHYKNGKTDRGVCFALNPKDTAFYLEHMTVDGESTGTTDQIRFSDLKAVFYVKSFDGKFDKSEVFREWAPEGSEVYVEFSDGEVVHGKTLHPYTPDEPRFYLIPVDRKSNNISILVEGSAIAGVYTAKEYKQKKEEEKVRLVDEGALELSQDESMGDFYFETRNYEQALENYQKAYKNSPNSGRLRKKMLASQFNIGVQHIKRRDYEPALACMEKVLKVDPANAHAKKKIAQLRKILEKSKKPRETKTFEADF